MKNVGLYKNRKLIKLYYSLGFARRGMQALYDNGKVMPDDDVYILWYGHKYYFSYGKLLKFEKGNS